jgi:integrase
MGIKVRDLKGDGNWWVVVHRSGFRSVQKVGPDKAEAEAIAAELRRREGLGIDESAVPRFSDFAERYLNEDTSHLADTTARDRRLMLEGKLGEYFATYRLSEVTKATIHQWWQVQVVREGRKLKTGRNYLDTLSAVFSFALDLELIDENPVDAFRKSLRRRTRTKQGRAAVEPDIAPIEGAQEIAAFVAESEGVGGWWHTLNLLLLDAGLRVGEAGGIRWCDVWWGRDDDDTTRHLYIRSTRPRGNRATSPKSGKPRKVALSKRLRAYLRDLWVEAGQPTGEIPFIPTFDPSNHRRRFDLACRKAGIGRRRPKDLRDTYACQLLTAGIPLGYISRQLGHAHVAVTARHYARWAGEDGYREPISLREGVTYLPTFSNASQRAS